MFATPVHRLIIWIFCHCSMNWSTMYLAVTNFVVSQLILTYSYDVSMKFNIGLLPRCVSRQMSARGSNFWENSLKLPNSKKTFYLWFKVLIYKQLNLFWRNNSFQNSHIEVLGDLDMITLFGSFGTNANESMCLCFVYCVPSLVVSSLSLAVQSDCFFVESRFYSWTLHIYGTSYGYVIRHNFYPWVDNRRRSFF